MSRVDLSRIKTYIINSMIITLQQTYIYLYNISSSMTFAIPPPNIFWIPEAGSRNAYRVGKPIDNS